MESNMTSYIQGLLNNLGLDDVAATNSLRDIAVATWRPDTSPKMLESFLVVYDDIRKAGNERCFWSLFEQTLLKEDYENTKHGLMELYLHLETYSIIEDEYLNELKSVLYTLFIGCDDASIHYQIFGYLMNDNKYKMRLLEIVEKNKDNYKNLVPIAERIFKVDDFMNLFKDIFTAWSEKNDKRTINFFIAVFQQYAKYIPYIASTIRNYYRCSNDKDKLNEFFYNVLYENKAFNYKETVEVVLSIYKADDILDDMLLKYKDFVQFSEEAATLLDDEYINDISTEICEYAQYVEIASAYTYELKENVIDLVKILKNKKANSRVALMAARKNILLNYEDLIKTNSIYREVKNSSRRYSERLKSNFTYNATDLRAFLKLDQNNGNLISALEQFGIQLYFEDFSSPDFTGCLFRFPFLRKAAIVVNRNLSGGRLLFTIAHELGHLVKAVSRSGEDVNDSLYLYFLYKESEDSCDKFASELLLPEASVKSLISHSDLDFKLISLIADSFYTSIEATLNRCINLSQDRYVLAVYENYKKKYFYCNYDHIGEFMDAEMKERLDIETFAHDVTENICNYDEKYFSSKIKESAELWFDRYKSNVSIKSQVFIQHKATKSIIVLLQFPNKELF